MRWILKKRWIALHGFRTRSPFCPRKRIQKPDCLSPRSCFDRRSVLSRYNEDPVLLHLGVILVRFLSFFLALTSFATSITFAPISKEVIETRLRSAPDNNSAREEKLKSLFEEAGCSGDAIQEQTVKDVKAPNVMCVLPGESTSVIAVTAHFDHVDKGRGIVDNWSGASMLPSIFQSLRDTKRRHTIRFIGFTGEEKGLLGSRYYVEHLTKDQRVEIKAAVNIDSLGLSSTKVEITRGDPALIQALVTVARNLDLPVSGMNVHAVGRSDSDSFQDRHIPTVAVHSVTNETLAVLHTERDQMEAIKLDDYYASYRLMAAYVAYLDAALGAQPEAPAAH
jgi:hypothetical protein